MLRKIKPPLIQHEPIFDAKRLIGQKVSLLTHPFLFINAIFNFARYSDKDVQRDLKMFPFKVVNKESKPCIEVDLKEGKKVFQAEENFSHGSC